MTYHMTIDGPLKSTTHTFDTPAEVQQSMLSIMCQLDPSFLAAPDTMIKFDHKYVITVYRGEYQIFTTVYHVIPQSAKVLEGIKYTEVGMGHA